MKNAAPWQILLKTPKAHKRVVKFRLYRDSGRTLRDKFTSAKVILNNAGTEHSGLYNGIAKRNVYHKVAHPVLYF